VGCGAALAYRNRAPRGVLLFVFGCTLAYILIGYPKGPIFVALGVALYTALVSGHRRVAWFVLLAGYPSFVWLAHYIGRDPPPSLGAILGVPAWLMVLLAVSEVVRSRR